MPEETGPPSPVPIPVIIDTDPGIDDCLALLLALNSPELDVRGISVSYGNTTIENAFRNAVEILRKVKRPPPPPTPPPPPVRVPLGIGARRPLKRQLQVADDTHGPSGLGYAELPPAGVILDYGSAQSKPRGRRRATPNSTRGVTPKPWPPCSPPRSRPR